MSVTVENSLNIMPVLPLRGLVVFPGSVLSFDVARKKSVAAVKYAMEHNRLIYTVAQKEIYTEDPTPDDVYTVGCVAKVRQVLKISDSVVKILVEGVYRAEHKNSFAEGGGYLSAAVERLEDTPVKNRPVYMESLVRRIRTQFEKYVEVYSNVSPDIIMQVAAFDDAGKLADFIASSVPAPYDDKQYVLEQTNPVHRAKILIEMLNKEREIGEIDKRIGEKTKAAIDENQREYYLREQIKAISNELYGDETADEIDDYHTKIEALKADDTVKEALHLQVNKLAKMPGGSHEGTVVRNYLDTCLELPWNKDTKTLTDVKKAEKILDRDIYGMKKVKERILEMLSVYTLAPDIKGQIICLVGPPGVGKTSIGKTISECMGRKFARISLGGVHDEAEIRGHRKTYIGAMPGKIIDAVKHAGSGNPLILLDEVDKLGSDYKGDPSSALLEVLDPEQNSTFTDNFIEIPYDLSRTVFIATANDASTIPAPLLDRMEVIEVPSYTREEKFNIAKRHLVKKEALRHGLTGKNFKLTDGAIYCLIDFYTREAGVRRLERAIASLCRKAARLIASGEQKSVTVTEQTAEKMLGHKRYKPEALLEKDSVGIINGLAWTSVGGEIMQLEVAVMDGTGKVELTGSLGNVMKESAMAAVSYVRSNAARLGIDSDFYKNRDIHIHATEAAVPKDGPSAGVTITVGLVSALTGKPVKKDIAMTGEVTIRGRVLPIGGLREKSMAAYSGGIKTVFIPKDNIADLDEVDTVVKENVRFVPVSDVDEIIRCAYSEPDSEKKENPVFPPVIKSPISAGRISQ